MQHLDGFGGPSLPGFVGLGALDRQHVLALVAVRKRLEPLPGGRVAVERQLTPIKNTPPIGATVLR